MINGKNASGIMTTVIPTSIKLHEPIGLDDLYIGKTTTGSNVLCVLPGLRRSAPAEAQQWMLRRATANLTGRCPVCDGCIDIQSEITSHVLHENWCNLSGRPKWIAKWLRK